MSLQGRLFEGSTSAGRAVEVELHADGTLSIALSERHVTAHVSELAISDRVGNTQRRIRFADGAMCELGDNDAIDQWLSRLNAHSAQHRVFRLERQWGVVIVAFLAVIVGSIAFIRYGVPLLAEQVARRLPTSIDDRIGTESLGLLDKRILKASALSQDRQQQIRAQFAAIIADLPDRQRYRLEFRQGGKTVGANAFALPSGIVVMTDELVEVSQDPNELTAVLAHEVGHVVNRHAVRMVLQSSASALLMFALLGDVSSVSSLAANAPVVLTQAKYSRQLESEADNYAYGWMKQHGIATHYFSDILLRLEKQHGGSEALSYFSSHPQTRERIRQ